MKVSYKLGASFKIEEESFTGYKVGVGSWFYDLTFLEYIYLVWIFDCVQSVGNC